MLRMSAAVADASAAGPGPGPGRTGGPSGAPETLSSAPVPAPEQALEPGQAPEPETSLGTFVNRAGVTSGRKVEGGSVGSRAAPCSSAELPPSRSCWRDR